MQSRCGSRRRTDNRTQSATIASVTPAAPSLYLFIDMTHIIHGVQQIKQFPSVRVSRGIPAGVQPQQLIKRLN